MKILVTGVAGFLGSHLAQALLERGHTVVGVDNLIGGKPENVPLEVEFYISDCLDQPRMFELMKNVDIVYHAACTAHEGLSVFSPHFITQNTYGASISVITAALQRRVKRFIYLSSASRYGELPTPYTEDMVPKPQDPYGIAKYAVELTLKNLAETHGMEYVIAVPHNIIGPKQNSTDPFRNVAAIFINLMKQGKSPSIYGSGLQERSFSFVSDVVEPLVTLATAPVSGEVINLGPDKGTTTIKELAELCKELTGFTGELNYLPPRPNEVFVSHCSADKARRLLGYEPKTDLRKGLQEMIDYIQPAPFEYNLPIEIESPLIPTSWTKRLF